MDVLKPLSTLKWVDRLELKPNNYNPNKVPRENLELLTKSILINGWTMPIVIRPDGIIIDGFHRWTISGPDWKYIPNLKNINTEYKDKTLYQILGGKVPCVIVNHENESEDIFGTVTHNRARGTHLLEPMKAIVGRLIDSGNSINDISKQLGMKPEEVFRLSNFTREDFLKMMIKENEYSKAKILVKY